MKKKNSSNLHEQDNTLLMEYMQKAIDGDFSLVDISAFKNPELGNLYNKVLNSFLTSNNNFVMRLNDSMSRIGDSSCFKEMIEQVNSQTNAINDMRGSSQELGESIDHIMSAVQAIQDNSHEAISTSAESVAKMTQSIEIVDISSEQIKKINDQVIEFQEKTIKITEIIDMVKKIAQKSGLLALNASIEAARAGESGRGFTVVANQIKDLSSNTTKSTEDVVKYVDEIRNGIDALVESIEETNKKLELGNQSVHESVTEVEKTNDRINSISNEIDNIYHEINNQSALTQTFVASIDSIADSYNILFDECVGTGEHLTQISHDVNKVRSDMARNNSSLSTLDWLTVFEIDHLIFTWRVYNNLADFENLEFSKLKNTKDCKLGKWMVEQTDSRITDSAAFKQLIVEHETLHNFACDSWNAKEAGDRETALKLFNSCYDTFQRLVSEIHNLRDVIKSTNDCEETDISMFSLHS